MTPSARRLTLPAETRRTKDFMKPETLTDKQQRPTAVVSSGIVRRYVHDYKWTTPKPTPLEGVPINATARCKCGATLFAQLGGFHVA
jgi:hypothetical protein